MSRLSAFFENKKKKVVKVAPPAALREEPASVVEPVLSHEDDDGWAVEDVETRTEPAVATGLKVNAIEAHVLESRKDKSWTTMRRLDEEHRRGIREMREREERVRLEILEGGSPASEIASAPATSPSGEKEKAEVDGTAASINETSENTEKDASQQQQSSQQGAAEAPKKWVSMRLLRMKAAEESSVASGGLRRGRQAAPNFEADPDLATAAQIAALKPLKKASRKSVGATQQQQQQVSEASESPRGGLEEQAREEESAEESEEEVSSSVIFFDFFKFVDLRNLEFGKEHQDDELVRAKYSSRPRFVAPSSA